MSQLTDLLKSQIHFLSQVVAKEEILRVKTYLNFDLHIDHSQGAYQAWANSPSGQASISFTIPFSEGDLQAFLLSPGSIRHLRPLDIQALAQPLDPKIFGQKLFKEVFRDDLLVCFKRSLDIAKKQKAGIRIRLHLGDNVPELAGLPWEYLYDTSSQYFFSLSDQTPIVRYVQLPESEIALGIKPPLRMLVVLAEPSDVPQLQIKLERERIQAALDKLQISGLIKLEYLEKATVDTLRHRLREGEIHIFHFIGHGTFDSGVGSSGLVLENELGKAHPITSEGLKVLLHDHPSLRLVFLNACEGARTPNNNQFASVAQSLVQQGLPAVIAMQFQITDDAAIELTHNFYRMLANRYPVDAALAEARKVLSMKAEKLEWGTPVLFMRAPDGHLFNIEHNTNERNNMLVRRIAFSLITVLTLIIVTLSISLYENQREFVRQRAEATTTVKDLAITATMAKQAEATSAEEAIQARATAQKSQIEAVIARETSEAYTIEAERQRELAETVKATAQAETDKAEQQAKLAKLRGSAINEVTNMLLKTAANQADYGEQLTEIGNIFHEHGLYQDALNYHLQALQIYQEIDNIPGMRMVFNRLVPK